MGTVPELSTHDRAPRGEVNGWSESATRRNTAFLRSVYEPDLNPPESHYKAFAITLTLKDCPPTAEDWQSLRRSFLKRLERLGLVRCHWVTEWQRRGVPHLHGAVWLPDSVTPSDIIDHWQALAEKYGSKPQAQYINPITDAVGWFKYLAKHASRGVSHYQRSSNNIPEGWRKTGRVWGYTGDWPLRDAIQFYLDDSAFYQFRRIVRGWRCADARESVRLEVENIRRQYDFLSDVPDAELAKMSISKRRIKTARHMLTCHKRELSNVRGVSEWVGQDITCLILDHLRANGCALHC